MTDDAPKPEILARYRREAGPPPGRKDAAWATLAATVAASPSPVTKPSMLGTAGAVAVGAGAILALGWLALRGPIPERAPVDPAPAPAAAAEEADEAPRPPMPVAPDETPDDEGVAPARSITPPRARRDEHPPTRGEASVERTDPAPLPAAVADGPTAASDLAAELALLEAARRALAASDAVSALASLDAHASRFARGALAADRELLRVRALCSLGRRDEAATVADHLEPGPSLTRALSRCGAP